MMVKKCCCQDKDGMLSDERMPKPLDSKPSYTITTSGLR